MNLHNRSRHPQAAVVAAAELVHTTNRQYCLDPITTSPPFLCHISIKILLL
jgi:hypothetical protein